MTIEVQLGRIADALETLAGVRDAPTPASEPETKADKKADKKADTKTETSVTVDDVRAALKALQKRTNAATAKKILSDRGAKTLSDLDEGDYAKVISEAESA